MSPSTAWREVVAADEEARFADYARQFEAMQAAKSQRFGNGRALHRKQVLAAHARLEVLSGLPAHARQGLFAEPGTHEAWIRLSNGGADRASDKVPDVRGFSMRVLGVRGPSALGGEATHQDFALINASAFAFPTSAPFIGLVMNASRGPVALLAYLVRIHGPLGGLRQLRKLVASIGKPFHGFACTAFHSAAPIACGPYAARVRLLPPERQAPATSSGDWTADMAGRLARADLAYTLQLQFFVDEACTPIEDASVDWPEAQSPYLSVARLVLPRQSVSDGASQALRDQVEAAIFDPWAALAAHRPLGEVMRARKVVYYASQQARNAAPDLSPPARS